MSGYLDLVGSFIYQEPVFRAKLDALAENDQFLKDNNWAQNTKALFYQAAVPTGWTKDVSNNDKALRVVGSTGGGVTGGSQALSTVVSLAHTHALPAEAGHTHAYADHTHPLGPAGTIRTSNLVIAVNAGFLYQYQETGGGSTIDELGTYHATSGAITLGTEPAHDHGGATESSLTDFTFAYCDVLVGTKDAPGGTYTDLTSYWSSGTKVDFDPFSQYAGNDEYNKANLIPFGTIMLFGQASAPDGWTKIAGTDDHMLRVVSGTGAGTGGDRLLSSGVVLAHANVVTAVADHTHSVPNHTHTMVTVGSVSGAAAASLTTEGRIQDLGSGVLGAVTNSAGVAVSAQGYKPGTTSSGGGSTSASGGHTHALVSSLTDFTLAHLDTIQCSKDTTGSTDVYTDMSAVFAWKKLVSKQRLNKLAANDSYVKFHITPSGSKSFFYMPTPPANWTKITTQHDKAIRIVSGGTGGSPGGGSQLLSSSISLAHTHAIGDGGGHTHASSHTHPLDSAATSIKPPGRAVVSKTGGRMSLSNTGAGAAAPGVQVNTASEAPTEQPTAVADHNHGGVTDSKLADFTLAYADVIYCTKD